MKLYLKPKYVLFLFLILAGNISAQLPKWTITPSFDTLSVKLDNKLIQGYTSGETNLWNMQGTHLFTTKNIILPFKDGVATVVEPNSPFILGFVDDEGNYTELPRLGVTFKNPYFESGYLLGNVKGKFIFFDKTGKEMNFPDVERLFPFHKGYAPYFKYDNKEKKKDAHYGYFDIKGNEVKFSIIDINGKEKRLDPKDIAFMSGIGINGKGVAVVNYKLYWVEPDSLILKPLTWGGDTNAKKQQLRLSGNHEHIFLNPSEDEISISARYGKDSQAQLFFNGMLEPTIFKFDDEEIKFEEDELPSIDYPTTISQYGEFGNYGLTFNSIEVLPKQFEKIGLKYGNRAFVKLNGKWGVLEMLPNDSYSLCINNNEYVAFRHQNYATEIRLDLPAAISAQNATIDIPTETGCILDKTSRMNKNTESGNFLIYNCILNIPEALPDTMVTLTYDPVRLAYDGVSLFDTPINIKAWHLKHHNVDLIESETFFSNGVATFSINIDAQKNVGEKDYPFEVRFESDSLSAEFEKISEMRYKCIVSNIIEGTHDFNIYVTEKGCPSSIFPFEIAYTKPIAKKKKKEEFIIRKKNITLLSVE